MAESELSKVEKKRAVGLFERKLGLLSQVDGPRRSWYKTQDGKTSIFITFSREDQLFYDVSPADLSNMLAFRKAFIVFLMGNFQEALIIPARRMQKLMENLEPKGNGDIKLHIEQTLDRYEFREVPRVNLVEYHNNFASLKK